MSYKDDDLAKKDGKKFTSGWGPEDMSGSDGGGGPVPEITSETQYTTGYRSNLAQGSDSPSGQGGVGEVGDRNYHDQPSSPPTPHRTKDGVNQSLKTQPPSGT